MLSRCANYRFYILIISCFFVALLGACAEKPSEVDVKDAIRRNLEQGITPVLLGNVSGGKLKQLKNLEIIEIGSSETVTTGLLQRTKRTVWPVKVHVQGVVTPSVGPFMSDNDVNLDKFVKYRIYADDQGSWNVAGEFFMLQ